MPNLTGDSDGNVHSSVCEAVAQLAAERRAAGERADAHSLKGSASHTGAVAVAAVADKLERAGSDDAEALLARLAEAVELTRNALGRTRA
jgi:HPt (histidine-containing phosphotransfer) domain-containing protein